MIATDTGSLVAYFTGERGADADHVAAALKSGELVLPGVVVSEMLADPVGGLLIEDQLLDVVILEITEGYWVRAGRTRRVLLKRGLKAKVADALIAQSCIDHDVALITRDGDFRHFAKHCGLKLA
jgi:predicted nucleic acid-binding protein